MALTVLQDPDCTFCRWTAGVLARLDWLRALRLPGVRRDLDLPGGRVLSRAEQLEELHVVDEQGNVERGFFAFRRIAAELPLFWPAVPFLYVPGVGLIGEPAYRWVSRHRDQLAKVLGIT